MCISPVSIDFTTVTAVQIPCVKQKKLLDTVHRAKVIKDVETGYNDRLTRLSTIELCPLSHYLPVIFFVNTSMVFLRWISFCTALFIFS